MPIVSLTTLCVSTIKYVKVKYVDLYSESMQRFLRHSDIEHTVLPANNTICLYLVSVHQMAPPPIEVMNN